MHIHIDYEFTDKQKLLIAEFLLIKTFRNCHSSDLQSNQTNSLEAASMARTRSHLRGWVAGELRLVGWLVGGLVGWLLSWLAGWLKLVDWWLLGWESVRLAGPSNNRPY